MNLGKLLGAGKSFISGGKSAAYREDKRFYVPQFASPKNPFATAGVAPVQAELPESAERQSLEQMKKIAALPWMRAQKLAVQAAPTRSTGAATWATKLNPVSFFRTAQPVMDKNVATVQTELSLEKVKVVHNDLTDADVEIVPMKSRPAPEPTFADARSSKRSWEALGERIMKATAL